MFDLTAIATFHKEGMIAGASFRSLLEAVEHSRSTLSLQVEIMLVLDRPDKFTLDFVSELASAHSITVIESDFGDQGKSRNNAVLQSKGEYIAFLDGDDLWGYNWLTTAYEFIKSSSRTIIAHPNYCVFFENANSVLINIDQEDPSFDLDYLRIGNYWDAMCMAHRNVHLDYPYCERNISRGIAYEDWHWNCETISAGIVHKVVPETIHFKRRQLTSQTIEASSTHALMPRSKLTSYKEIGTLKENLEVA